ncbi:MAG: hypothetical protein BWY21_02356 [Parcubacteria group bacterium ADurb.Bin216]|nr:MAG: hypothetical protein BWY21_02356 [Parcubacteria group bacterium ADurb.Bin216]
MLLPFLAMEEGRLVLSALRMTCPVFTDICPAMAGIPVGETVTL